METNEPFPTEITKAISAFVDRIEQALLQNGTSRAERTSVCAEVETQIHAMIERRLEAGSELNMELVLGIIESMDQPESYAKSNDTVPVPDPVAPANASTSSTPQAVLQGIPATLDSLWQKIRKIWNRPTRTKPGLDWVAVAGLVPMGFGLLSIIFGMGRHNEFLIVAGFFWIFVSVIMSGISFWRIRHSNGLLTGQRIASIGVLMLPIVLANLALFSILFATPIGRVLGALILILMMAYANYRLIKYSLRWLDSYYAATPVASVDPTESVQTPTSDAGPISGIIVTP